MKKFCESLREHTKNIIEFERKINLPLTKEQLKLHQVANNCYICRKRFSKSFAKDKNYQTLSSG